MAERPFDRLRLASYNCRGVNAVKIDFIGELLTDCDIVFLQEHWMLDEGLSLMERQLRTAHVFGKSGMDANRLLAGRPYGGCAILVKKTLQCTVTPIDTSSRRLYSCIIRFPNDVKMLLHNVYMPVDTYYDESNIGLYNDILSEIDYVNISHDNIENIVIAGDFNTDLSRDASLHCSALLDFCESRDLRLLQLLDVSQADFTYLNASTNVSSLIDHFIASEALCSSVMRYECLHIGHNLSDHCPIILTLNVTAHQASGQSTRNARLRYSWHKATENDIMVYKYTLSEILHTVELPFDVLGCQGYECVCNLELINVYYNEIVNACLTAADCAIPKSGGGSRRLAGWVEHVKPYRDRSLMWFRMWLENGRPGAGVVYECMKKAKRDYKRVSRWVLRNQEKLTASKMADALLSKRERDFWTEVNKKCKGAHSSVNYVDDACGDEEIGELFSQRFNELYNSVSFEQPDLDEVMRRVNAAVMRQCSQGSCYCDHRVNVNDVKKACRSLKGAKSDVREGITSDCFVHGCDELYLHISMLINVMIVHSFAPDPFLCATVIPIPKNVRKSKNSSANYRSIAIGNIVGKILDKIVLAKHAHILDTSELQFGFKNSHSTVQCTFVFNEIVQLFTSKGSHCYTVLLDATKAFDRVHFVKLFSLLLERSMCPTIVKLLVFMYTNQSLRVRWHSSTTDPFLCSNGIKQGGVLSPILFCVYMDEVLKRLKECGVGCRMGDLFAGALCYADDLCLLAPSRNAAQLMLSVCEQFARDFNVMFNSQKSKLIVFSPLHWNGSIPQFVPLSLFGAAIDTTECELHLGNFVGRNGYEKNVARAIQDLMYRTNVLMSRFGNCQFMTRLKLFYSYCTSFYGSPLYNHSTLCNTFTKLIVAFKKSLKKVMKLNVRTKSILLELLSHKPDLRTQLLKRLCKFLKNCLSSRNQLIHKTCMSSFNSFSNVGQNFRTLLAHVKLNLDLFHSLPCSYLLNLVEIDNVYSDDVIARCNVITELCNVLDGTFELNVFERFELRLMLDSLCTYEPP